MRSPRFIRTIAVVGMSALVLGAFAAAPADAKKKKKPKACAAYQPGEKGAEKPTVVVTDAHTEEAPLAQAVALDASAADFVPSPAQEPGLDAFNVQVDSKAKDAGLYVLFEFPMRRDYDLEMYHDDGSYAARSHDFNLLYSPDPRTYSNAGHAGESSDTYEKIVGVRTNDCGGYTVEAVNWLGEGGDFEIKLWLGEVVNDPLAPGEEVPE